MIMFEWGLKNIKYSDSKNKNMLIEYISLWENDILYKWVN